MRSTHTSKHIHTGSKSRFCARIAVLCAAFGLSIGYKYTNAPFIQLEQTILRLSTPIASILHTAHVTMSNVSDMWKTHHDLRAHIHALQSQNEHLNAQNLALSQAAFQYKHIHPSPQHTHTYADVLQHIRFGQPLLIKMKGDKSLQHNSIILGSRGVLGRATHAQGAFGKVITLFDANSRIPVDIRGVQGIAAGQNTDTLKLIYTKNIEIKHIKIGDPVYTSGFGGIFPKGLRLGRVSFVSSGEIHIQPFEKTTTTPHSVAVIPPVLDNATDITHTI